MGEPTKIIAKASDSTNTTPESVVVVEAKPSVQVTYRFFAADFTAILSGKTVKDPRAIDRFPFVLGVVSGGSLQPFDKRIAGLPPATWLTGRLEDGGFEEFSTDDLAERDALLAKIKDSKLDAAEREKLKKQVAVEYGHVCKVKAHVVQVPKRIEPGTTVGICFGVDVKTKFRQYPLWQVSAGDNDIVVDVFETYGKHSLDDKANLIGTLDLGTEKMPKPTDFYGAKLTGDIWMRSTHPFTEADVASLSNEVASDVVKLALKRIYTVDFEVQKSGDFGVDVPSLEASDPDLKIVKLVWIAAENSNCIDNIRNLDIKSEVPRRIHPAAYAAVAKAAHAAGVTTVKFTSSWRPMLGSAAHRTGLGLDLKWLLENGDAIQLNRKGLLTPSATDKNHDGLVDGKTNISVDEQTAFNDWKSAEQQAKTARTNRDRATALLAAKNQALAAAKKMGNAKKVEKAEHEAAEAKEASTAATQASKDASDLEVEKQSDWSKSLDKNEPGIVGRYRRLVMKESCITQVIDPWYVDLNTRDKVDPQPNAQTSPKAARTPNQRVELLHNNHMHLTIDDPELRE